LSSKWLGLTLPYPPAFGYRSAHGRRPTKTFFSVCRFLDNSSHSFYLHGHMAVLRTVR
jgi:hypothetical protein